MNWRIDALMLLAVAAMLLIFSESEKLSVLIATKVVGFALAYGCWRLAQRWDAKGLIDELSVFDEQ